MNEDAYEAGRRDGYAEAVAEWQRSGSPFPGVRTRRPGEPPPRFSFETSWFSSFVSYEHDLVEAVRHVQRSLWLAHSERRRAARYLSALERELERVPALLAEQRPARRWRLERSRPWRQLLDEAREDLARNEREVDELRELKTDYDRELWRVRAAVDAEGADGRGRAYLVDALRLEPNRPDGVRELPDLDTFVAEDPRRAVPGWPRRRDAGGEDWGRNWRLENPIRRWETTQWRISWLSIDQPTYEVYALEFVLAGVAPSAATSRRVWILGTVESRATLEQALDELRLHAQQERNSLVAAARAVQRAARASR